MSGTPVTCINIAYLSADIQLVSEHGRHCLRSSFYRTLVFHAHVPLSATEVLLSQDRMCGTVYWHYKTDHQLRTVLGNICDLGPRNCSALWFLIVVRYTNNLTYLHRRQWECTGGRGRPAADWISSVSAASHTQVRVHRRASCESLWWNGTLQSTSVLMAVFVWHHWPVYLHLFGKAVIWLNGDSIDNVSEVTVHQGFYGPSVKICGI